MLGATSVVQAVQFVYSDTDLPADEPTSEKAREPVPPPAQALPNGAAIVDGPLGLQPARGLNMPGAAAPGRPRPDSSPGLPTVADTGTEPLAGRKAPENEKPEYFSQKGESKESDVVWAIPPIRWGGAVGYSMQRTSSSNGQSSFSQNLFSNLSATSYIYAPWAATVSARLGLSTGSSNGSSSVAGIQGNSDHNSSVVGGADLNIFPTSRFPFQAYFDRSDSRASGTIVNNDYVNTRFGVRQTYRAEDGVTSAGGQIDHSTVVSNNGAKDTLTALSGNFATDIGIVKNSVNGRYSLGQRDGTGERARLLGFNTTHNANLGDNLNLSGNVSYLDNALRTGNGLGSVIDSRTRFIQFNGFGTWMPEFEDNDQLPLTLSGGVNYSNLRNEFGGQGIDSQNVGANVNALYRFSNNLTAGANAALNHISTLGSPGILLTLLGTNVNYAGDPLMFGNYSYNWNVGASANWQKASGTIPSDYFASLQAGHSVGRFISLSDSESLSLSLSQNVNVSKNQTVGNSNSLTHSLAASYGLRWGEQFSGTSTLSVSDILTTGANAQHYRMLGLGFSGVGQLSQFSAANVNLQFNWNEQTINNRDDQSFGFQSFNNTNTQHMTLQGSASYTHSRFMGVRGLRQTLLFTVDTRMRDDRLLGNINGDIERTRWTLSSRLDYRYGLLDFRATASINDVGGKKNAQVFFQVSRQIGAY